MRTFLITIILAITLFFATGHRAGFMLNTGSMEPAFSGGDIVITKNYNGKGLDIGDMVVFKSAEGYRIFHRVVDILPAGYMTQGDNALFPDADLLTDDEIIAKHVATIKTSRVPVVGKFAGAITEKVFAE